MRRLYFIMLTFLSLTVLAACDKDEMTDPNREQEQPDEPFQPSGNSKILVAYFSATGTTQGIAEEIAEQTGADIYRIRASEPYAADPYDDSDRIQDEAYNDRRPGVSNLPENLDDYDTIFIGSPIWWHYPAMVVCTFLENYDLSGKTVIPFFTYGATTYLQQSIDKIHEVTPNSIHLETFGSTGSASGVSAWLQRLGFFDEPETPEEPENPNRPESKALVAYFSATGNTQRIAERIAELTGAELYSIEPTDSYASNPYDDSDRIQDEAYNDRRPGVNNLPENLDGYDIIYVGSPIWWHQPAMVVCTFLEAYDLSEKTVVPFFTYGATTYLNEAMQKIYKVTSNSTHVPATLPEDLNPGDITTPGPSDDSGIDMPGSANGVEAWLNRLGLIE